jgi:hypothetical protein
MRLWILLALAIPASAIGAEKLSSFAYGLPVKVDGADALYRLMLPPVVYKGAVRRDLGDLRVFNGAEEVVPHAFNPRSATETRKREPVALKLFPLHGEAPAELAGMSLRVQRSASGTLIKLDETPAKAGAQRRLLGYLVDASALEQPVRALELEIKGAATYTGNVTVEASEDLAAWHSFARGPIVSLQHEGAKLEQRRIEFAARKPKYLRVSWHGMPAGAEIAALRAELGDARIDVARQWEAFTAAAPAKDKPGEYEVDTGGVYPADRIVLELPQVNTVAQVQLLSRATADAPWRPVTTTTVYKLRREGAEVESPAIAIAENADRYWLAKVDQKGGGLGAGELKVRVGWLPHEIVWVARGSAPFTLAYGSREAKPSAYAIETVVPGYKRDTDIGAKVAAVGDAAGPRLLGGEAALKKRIDVKKWTLWGALVLGVLFLGWMAWRLMRQMEKK